MFMQYAHDVFFRNNVLIGGCAKEEEYSCMSLYGMCGVSDYICDVILLENDIEENIRAIAAKIYDRIMA